MHFKMHFKMHFLNGEIQCISNYEGIMTLVLLSHKNVLHLRLLTRMKNHFFKWFCKKKFHIFIFAFFWHKGKSKVFLNPIILIQTLSI